MEFSVDDKSVFAATGGRPFDPALPSIVFVHGAAMDHTVWALQTRYFAHHGRNVLAIDLPGHGRSAGPALADMGAMADWVIRVLDALGVETRNWSATAWDRWSCWKPPPVTRDG